MSVLIYIDNIHGKVNKAMLETLCYGGELARRMNVPAEALFIGKSSNELSAFGKYGIAKVYTTDAENELSDAAKINLLQETVEKSNAEVVVFYSNQTSKTLSSVLAARLKAGIVTGVIALPDLTNGFVVKKSVYSGKAFAKIKITSPIKILAVNAGIVDLQEISGEAVTETIQIPESTTTVKVLEKSSSTDKVSLTEADKVVSGGMGLKGPENWHLITDLAEAMHAAAACSRPVSDNGWRPHNEHVGQTGIQIAPELYVAIGISGAIQHLGGVNRSKYIVAINKDAEAPIFKAADFGMVGDLFDIVPKLTEEIKK